MSFSFGVLLLQMHIVFTWCAGAAAVAPNTMQLSPSTPGEKERVIAEAKDTSLDILRSSDGLFAWKFIPYKNHTRLLVVLSTRYNTTVIWIANRERPIGGGASLRVAFPSFELILRDADGSVVWAVPPSGVHRILLNTTGNLLLQNAHSDTLWASFDHLADVLLPGQRIRTNHSMTSSLAPDDVRPGRYMLAAEPGGAVLYASFDSQQHQIPYKFVSYAEGSAFTSTLSVVLGSACNHTSILYNADGGGVTLQQEGRITAECAKQANGQLQDTSHGITFANTKGGTGFRYIRLLPTGDVSTFFLSSEHGLEPDSGLFGNFFGYCQLPSYCGANSFCSSSATSGVNCSCPQLFHPVDTSDLTQGCVLDTPLNCNKSNEHQFLQIDAVQYYANAFNLTPVYHVQSADDCKSACLANCSCTAAFFDNITSACHLYDQVQTMTSGTSSVTAFLRVEHLPPKGGEAVVPKRLIIELSFAVGAVVLCVVFGAACIARRIMRPSSLDDESDLEEESFLESLPGLPPRYSYKELHAATQGFSKKLGEGGSGTVYEGALPDPAVRQNSGATMIRVAVKELKLSERATIATCSKKLFRAEVASLGSASHVNLVQLRGFCAEGAHRLLVYEFMENGSLDRWIFRRRSTQRISNNHYPRGHNDDDEAESTRILSWDLRLRIAQQTARGLAFLHEECRDKVVHLDVKPQNILLDGSFRAKLADFGLCKLIDREHGPGLNQTVTAMRGTPGYMAPEWFLNLPVTDKSDVFSYGMVLLELIGGRKNVDMAAPNEDEWYFPAWAVRQAERDCVLDVVEDCLRSVSNSEMEDEMRRVIHVAFWCIQEGAASRPAMSTVLLMLEGHLPVPNPPLELAYVFRSRPSQVASTPSCPSNISGPPSVATFSSVLLPR